MKDSTAVDSPAPEALPIESLTAVSGGANRPTPTADRAWNGREYRPLDSNGHWLIEY